MARARRGVGAGMTRPAPGHLGPQAQVIQGILVPNAVIDPPTFFANTRRQRFTQAAVSSWNGIGGADQFSLRQAGIIAAVDIRLYGSLVVTLNGGTCATTSRWPYGILKRGKLSANNISQLMNCGGWFYKARELARTPGLTDRGVTRGSGGASPGTQINQGTLSLDNESWGVGQNVTAIPGGTYTVDLTFRMPVAWDLELLGGALFAQTSATDLAFELDYALASDLFVLTGSATAVLSLTYAVDGVVFTIPRGPGGEVVLPDLSVFHTFVQSNATGLGQTENEVDLAGQGVGKQLLACYFDFWTGATSPGSPLVLNDTNYGAMSWGYGGNQRPEKFPGGTGMAYENERTYGSALSVQGIGCWDWASHWAFRDSIDMGSATQIALFTTLQALPSTYQLFEYAQEIIVPGTAAGTSVGNADAYAPAAGYPGNAYQPIG
jgi:hypothetical protein